MGSAGSRRPSLLDLTFRLFDGLGALAFGCGTTELAHILATQVMAMKRPKRMRVLLEGTCPPHVTAKDVALRIIADIGVAFTPTYTYTPDATSGLEAAIRAGAGPK